MWILTDQTDQHHPFAFCSPEEVSALVHQLVSGLTLTTVEEC